MIRSNDGLRRALEILYNRKQVERVQLRTAESMH
jgi:hypothetical protein